MHRLNRILKLAGESTDYSSIIASSVTGKQSWRQSAPCDSKKTAPCRLQFVCERGEHEMRLPKFEWFLSLTRTLLKQWLKLFLLFPGEPLTTPIAKLQVSLFDGWSFGDVQLVEIILSIRNEKSSYITPYRIPGMHSGAVLTIFHSTSLMFAEHQVREWRICKLSPLYPPSLKYTTSRLYSPLSNIRPLDSTLPLSNIRPLNSIPPLSNITVKFVCWQLLK